MPTRRLQRTAESPQHADLSSSAPDAEADLAPPVIPSLQPKPAPSPRSSKPKKKTRARRGKSKRRTVTIPDDNVPVSLAPSAQMRDSNRGPASQPAGAKATGDLDMTPTAKLPDAKSSHHTAAVTILRIVSVTSSLPAVPSALPPDAQAKTPTSSRESLPMLEVEPASVPTIEELPPPPRRKRVATTPPDQTAAALAGKTIPEGSDELTSKRRLPPPRSIQPPPDGGPANGTATTPAPPTSPTPPAARKAAAPKKNKSPRAAAKPPTRQKRDWWQELYGEDMLRTLDNPRQKDVEKDVDFMLSSLELSAGSNILDLACGAGVHAVELASRGYQVVGIDLSPVMLKLARSYNDNRSQRVSFLESDMRQLSLEAVCDGIVCWSASFGYFDDETNEDVLRRMAKALRPGGRLLLDIPNRDYAAYNSPTMAWFEKRGAVCMDETRFDFKTSRLMAKRMVMFDDGRSRELAYDMRLYSLHEVQQLLKRTGFRVLEVSGHRAHRGAFFGAESDRIMLLAARVE